MSEGRNDSFSLRHIAAQHHDLQQRVRALKRLLQEPVDEGRLPELFAEFRRQMRELFELMRHHFVEEAEGGYLEEAVARVPQLGPAANALEAEHPQLAADAKLLLDGADLSQQSSAVWRDLAARFGPLATRMLTHETTENRLLQQGFNADPALFE